MPKGIWSSEHLGRPRSPVKPLAGQASILVSNTSYLLGVRPRPLTHGPGYLPTSHPATLGWLAPTSPLLTHRAATAQRSPGLVQAAPPRTGVRTEKPPPGPVLPAPVSQAALGDEGPAHHGNSIPKARVNSQRDTSTACGPARAALCFPDGAGWPRAALTCARLQCPHLDLGGEGGAGG